MTEYEELYKHKNFKDIPQHVKDYVQTKVDYYKTIVAEKGSEAAAYVAAGALWAVCGIFFLLFGLIAAALAIGSALDSMALGFLIVAGIFLLIIIITALLFKPLFKKPIEKAVISSIYNTKDGKKYKNG